MCVNWVIVIAAFLLYFIYLIGVYYGDLSLY